MPRRTARRSFTLLFVVAAGCAPAASPVIADLSVDEPVDLAMRVLPPDFAVPASRCGHPGDTGNSLGVGRFCTGIADCLDPSRKTNVCSTYENGLNPSPRNTYYCTFECMPLVPDGGASECGDGAVCRCQDVETTEGCLCIPIACLNYQDGGVAGVDASSGAARDAGG